VPPSRRRCWIRASACWPCHDLATPLRSKGLPFPNSAASSSVQPPSKAAAVPQQTTWRSTWLCLQDLHLHRSRPRTRIA